MSPGNSRPGGIRGDLSRLFSPEGTGAGTPSLGAAVRRVLTRPGPQAVALYRASHWLWTRRLEVPAELVWRVNYFLTGADIKSFIASDEQRVRKVFEQEGWLVR